MHIAICYMHVDYYYIFGPLMTLQGYADANEGTHVV